MMGSWPWLLLVCFISSGNGQVGVSTLTRKPTTETLDGGSEVYSGTTMTFKDTTLVLAATTSVYPAQTETRSAQTITFFVAPEAVETITDQTAFADIEEYASTVTSLASSEVDQAVTDLEAYYTSVQPDTPYIIYKAPNDLANEFYNNRLDRDTLERVFVAMYDPWNASHTSVVASLLQGKPSLFSEVQEFMSVGKTFLASSLSVVGSIVTKDLSLTGAPPTWVSEISAATASLATATMTAASPATATTSAATATSTSTGGAAPTVMPGVLLNVGALAAGMAVLAGL